MRNFKNNFRKNRYRNHADRNSQNNNGTKLIGDFQNGSNFMRNSPGRNNHNAPKLIEKYSNLAREALSNGDKILSENYYQHAEHFIRILGEKDSVLNKNQELKINNNSSENQKNISNIEYEVSKQSITTKS